MPDATLTDADRKIARKLLAVGHADICPHCESRIAAALRASREQQRRYETAGRTWIQALDMMRMLSVHDPMQKEVVNLMARAEKQMRAALGEGAT